MKYVAWAEDRSSRNFAHENMVGGLYFSKKDGVSSLDSAKQAKQKKISLFWIVACFLLAIRLGGRAGGHNRETHKSIQPLPRSSPATAKNRLLVLLFGQPRQYRRGHEVISESLRYSILKSKHEWEIDYFLHGIRRGGPCACRGSTPRNPPRL